MAKTRRTALKRALMVLGGIAGVVATRGVVDAGAGKPSPAQTETLSLHGRDWHIFSRDLNRGELPAGGVQMVGYGDLHVSPESGRVGEFYGTYVSLHRPGWVGPLSSIEQHTFVLADGSIMGSGTTKPGLETADDFAIVGGTGRYAGVRGTYVLSQSHQELGGDGTARVTFTFSTVGVV
jgi:hypothetical protein